MKWIITHWDGKNSPNFSIQMTWIEHLDGMGEIYRKEAQLGLKAQGILK